MDSDQPVALERQQLKQAESELGTFWHRVRSEAVVNRLVEKRVREVVDVGAGAGHLGGWLVANEPAIRYRFLEPLDEVRSMLVAQFGESDGLSNVGEIDGADAVTMLDVLEHIEDDRSFLVELHDNMKSGANLLITVPCHPVLFSDWDEKLGHFRRYNKKSLRKVVEDAGFVVESTVFMFPELLIPAALRNLPSRKESSGEAEFPELPEWIDRVAFRVSQTTARLGRFSPGGTSLFLTARRP